MTTPTTEADTVRELLAHELSLNPAEISDNDVLGDLPGADSLRLLRLVTRLERHWDIEFSDEEVFGATTFADLVTLVRTHVGRP